jgi:hypothetical protein
MSNVVQFKRPVGIPKPARVPTTFNGNGDSDNAEVYHLSDVLMAVAWAAYTGDIRLADKLTNFVKECQYPHWVELPSDLGRAVESADLKLGASGFSNTPY